MFLTLSEDQGYLRPRLHGSGQIFAGTKTCTWRRTVEKERNQSGWHSWGAAVASAADRDGWRNLLAGLKSPHGPD